MRMRTTTTRHHLAALAALTLTLSLSLVACGDDSPDGADSSAGDPGAVQTASNGDVFNGADVAFATDMIPHHAQAIEMVTLTQGRTLDPEVAALAEEVRAAQSPEVEQMVDWLTAWGEDVPETSLDHANAGHHSDDTGDDMGDMGDMPGMMSGQQMSDLAAAPDADFQELWLSMMVEHHTGAIEMARTEIEDGRFADAITLAESIVESQQVEIDRMEALLAS